MRVSAVNYFIITDNFALGTSRYMCRSLRATGGRRRRVPPRPFAGQEFGNLFPRSSKLPFRQLSAAWKAVIQESNQAESYNEIDDEYAGKFTGLASESHSNSHRGHIFATSNFSAFRIHSRPGEKQICAQLNEI